MTLILFLALAAQIRVMPGAPPAPAAEPAQATRPEDLCSIEGRVLNAGTGEPVRKANLVMRRVDQRSGSMGMPAMYTTGTDAGGRFAMKDLEPGQYRLMVNRTGFVGVEYGASAPGRSGTTLALDRGRKLTGIVFRLTPHAVIAGRVVDEDGEPVAQVSVQALRYRYILSRRHLTPMNMATTNDLGEYRIFGLAPGRYYVSAVYRGGTMADFAQDRSATPAPDEGYIPTYYAGTTDASAAAPVDLTAGQQLRGIDLTLSRARTVRIRGRVVRPAGSGRANIVVQIVPREGYYGFGTMRPAPVDPQGNFEIRGVAPGAYSLTASTMQRDNEASVRQPVDVGTENIENVTLTLVPGIELAGEIKVEGNAGASLSGVRIFLRPREQGGMMFGPAPSAQVGENGTFKLQNVSAEDYVVMCMGLPDGYYVKSIRAGDETVRSARLDFTRGAVGPVTITLSPNAGQIEGVVLNEKQEASAGATVVLVPQDAEKAADSPNFPNTTTDQYGRFTFKTVDPGEYRAFAWQDVEPGAYTDPEFRKPVENKSERVSIREGSRESVQLNLIPAQQGEPASEKGRPAAGSQERL